MAVGDLMGSILFKLLILGVLDLLHRSGGRILSRLSAAHALSATMSVTLTALAGIAIVTGFRASLGGVGIGSAVILGADLLGIRLVYYD